MPAASYREGPDGHSSRKQNSKRRRAKCSPSFVSGRVIGHGDISPRCIPECSAMARCTAPYPLLAPAAPALCLSCFWRGRSPSPAFGAVFMRGGRQLFGAGRIQAFVHGKIFANAFSGDWQWQYSRAVRSRASIRGKTPPRCVPGRQSVAIFSSHASPRGLRTGKSPVRGKICAPCIRKAPQTAVWEYTARRSCQEGAPFAARAPRIMHGAQILPSSVAPNRPSARNPGAAEQCEPPELDRPTQETQPRRQRPRRLLGSKYRQQPPRYRHRSLPTPASSLSPRRTTLSSPTAPPVETTSTPPPPRRFAELRSPKGEGYLPYLWRLSSVLLADAIGL